MSLPLEARKTSSEDPKEEQHPFGSPPDDVVLATAGYDHTVKFWQADTGRCLRTLQHADSQVNALEISPEGHLLAAAGYQHIRMFDVNSNSSTPVVNYEGISKNVMALGFQDNGRWMYTGGEDGTARIWDLRVRNLHCQRMFHANCPVNSAVLHQNQHDVILGDQNGFVHIWNLKTDARESYVPELGSNIQSVAIDPSALFVAAVTNKGTCYYSGSKAEQEAGPATGTVPPNPILPNKKLQAHKRYALKCKFSPDSSYLVTSSADHTAKLWRTRDFRLQTELKLENERWVWDVAFSADSAYLFTASSDNFARLWAIPHASNNYSAKDVERVYKENGHQKAVTCLAFRDGSGAN